MSLIALYYVGIYFKVYRFKKKKNSKSENKNDYLIVKLSFFFKLWNCVIHSDLINKKK